MKFTAKGLELAGSDLLAPLMVALQPDPNQDPAWEQPGNLQITEVARVLPGRRLSGSGSFNGRPVFAKLFYGSRARRYWLRELTGAANLQRSGISTPALLARGAFVDGGGYFVIYVALGDAQNLAAHVDADISDAVALLAELHGAGFIQEDIHVGNFVRSESNAYMVDADGVRRAHLLRHQIANLALLLAQRAPACDGQIDRLWREYAALRGEYTERMSSAEVLVALTQRQRQRRVRRYLAKTQRECTEFVHRRTWQFDWLCDRRFARTLQRFMIYPEALIADGTPIKLGNSATVVRIDVDGERFIVKRYNIKNLAHRIRRWFKRRARRAWCNGHQLAFLEIPTARPIALLEQRFGWFAGVSYLVMPDCGERDLAGALAQSPEAFEQLAPQAVALLNKLRAAGLRHGDLKATNFVLSDEGLVLIDYDALTTGDSSKDVERFVANWADDSELSARWVAVLEEAAP